MSDKQIVIILGSPGRGATLLAKTLRAALHEKEARIDPLEDYTTSLAKHLELNPLAPAPIDHNRLIGSELRTWRLEARKLVYEQQTSSFPLIHTHVAAPLLIPFWQECFEDTDINLQFVLLGTNALQSVDELSQHHGLEIEVSIMVWAQSLLHTMCKCDKTLFATHYADFLSEPESTLHSIIKNLNLHSEHFSEKRIRKLAEDVFSHNQSDRAYTLKDVERHEEFPDFIKDLNSVSKQIHATFISDDDTSAAVSPFMETYSGFEFFLTGARKISNASLELHDKASTTKSLFNQLEVSNKELESKIVSLTEQNSTLANNSSELNVELERLREELHSAGNSNNEQVGILTEKNESLNQTVFENEKAIADLQKLLEQQRYISDEKIHTLQYDCVQLTEKHKGAENLAEEIRKERTHDRHRYNIERASFKKQFKEYEEKLKAAEDASKANLTEQENEPKPDHSDAVRLAVEEAREQMNLELESEKRALLERARAAEQQLLDQDSTLAHYKMEAESAQQEIRALKNSTSWKLSAPVRGAKNAVKSPRTTAKTGIKRTGRLLRKIIPGRQNASHSLASPAQNKDKNQLSISTPLSTNRLKDGDLGRDDDISVDANNAAPLNNAMVADLEGCVEKKATTPPDKTKARAIAFYLPQYHQIPENDAWWGEGFTEWTNVKPSTSQFPGHYQPHIPGDLGWYDLATDNTILQRQTEMAKVHGLSGFAFYFYWFAGKRLLEAPILRYLEDKSIDFPFCLCWANENWNRRWDGNESEILISQNHSSEDDIQFISYLAKYLRDPRYIRIDGKPVVLVYRPGLLPSSRETTDRWREWCHKNGIGDIYLAYTQGFEKVAPHVFGFDAAIEFPPNNHGLTGTPNLIESQNHNFKGKVFDWRDLVKRSKNYPDTSYTLFRGVNPSWDNTPRRGEHGTVLLNSNPQDYYHWLNNAITDTHARISNPEEQLIFINAWNEWAEGAHLEPDEKYGFAWLEATRRALSDTPTLADNRASTKLPDAAGMAQKKILIVTHDLYRHGAQYLSLNFARTLKEKFGYNVEIIAGKDGPLKNQFETVATLKILEENSTPQSIATHLTDLKNRGFDLAIVNSCASGWLSPHLAQQGIKFIGLVHEMQSIITSMNLKNSLDAFNTHAERVIFPATIVRDQGASFLPSKSWNKAEILPQGVYKIEGFRDENDKQNAKQKISAHLKIPDNATIILGVGFADHRKGIDLFLNWAQTTIQQYPDAHFIWIGEISKDMQEKVDTLLHEAAHLRQQIHLPGFTSDTSNYFLAADIYALSSREDPFPSTALEALNAATPVVMMSGTGGIEDLSAHGCVICMKDESSTAFIQTVTPWLKNSQAHHHAGLTGNGIIREKFGFTSYVSNLLERLHTPTLGVSVIVPNYNYERHLEQRLTSIIEQTVPPREIIFLDDASTDKSVSLARKILSESGIHHKIIINEQNSGNVFAQWQKGVDYANHPVTWIAEADDWADRKFLETLTPHFNDTNLSLAYSQSRQIDESGKIIAPDYRDYVRDISEQKWGHDFLGNGRDEVAEGFAVKNTIPNVSGALFRTDRLQAILSTDIEFVRRFRTAGDWYVYVNLLREGDLYFSADPLNHHRRHDNSVTISKFDLDDLSEIADMQHYVITEFSLGAHHQQSAQNYLNHLIDHFNLKERYTQAELARAMDT